MTCIKGNKPVTAKQSENSTSITNFLCDFIAPEAAPLHAVLMESQNAILETNYKQKMSNTISYNIGINNSRHQVSH